MTWTLPRSVKLGFAAAMLVLCTIGLISIWSTARFVRAATARRVSYEVRARLAGLFSHVQDAETGQRGYLLTGREAYLAPFTSGSQAATRDLEQLQRSGATHSLPQYDILDQLIGAKLAELSHSMALRRRGGLAAALPAVATDWGRVVMDSIRSVIASMDSVESDRTARADAQVRATGRAALIIGALGTLLAVALVGAAIVRIGRDIAARTRAEEGLVAAEGRLRHVTASSTAVIYAGTMAAEKFTPTWVSENVTRMMGYAPAEALGSHWWLEHLHAEDRDRVLGEMSVLLATNQLTTEYRFQHHDGTWRWVRDESRLLQGGPGEPSELFGAWVDVTERRRAEEALRRYAAELEAANAELDAFAYSVSHDLRTPLRGINGFSLALLEDYGGKLDDTGRDYLQRVRAASERMAQLIDDLLNLSRVTRAELRREAVDVSGLACGIVEGLERSDPARRVSCTIAAGLRVRGDPHLLRVALENLIGNAWKYTNRRSDARIELGVVQRDGQTAYYVRDNGVGFDMAHAGNLFGAFQRLHSDREFEGTGIGLATVQRIVQRHGGRVWAESSVGQGATFYFTL